MVVTWEGRTERMDQAEWDSLILAMQQNLAAIQGWEPCPPDPEALLCEQSRHRTLAHLRACQEQWLIVVGEFIEQESPRVKILHPWRHFEVLNYAEVPWQEHMAKFVSDRQKWISLSADPNRGGKWNQKPDTIGNMTRRLVRHECGHLKLIK